MSPRPVLGERRFCKKNKKTKKTKIRRLYEARHFPQIFGFLFLVFFSESDVWKGRGGKAEEETLGVFSQPTPNAPKAFHTTFHE